MSLSGLLSVNEVNELDLDGFLWLFGNVIEKNTASSKFVHGYKPFKSANHIAQLYCKYLDSLPQSELEKILLTHPDLGTSLKMTEESIREQSSCGLNNLSAEEKEELSELNMRYREKFAFPFVICARKNKANTILDTMKRRLENSRELELKTGIDEVKKIGLLRVYDLVWHD